MTIKQDRGVKDMAKEADTFRYHLADLKRAFPDRKFIYQKEFAKYLGVDISTIYKWTLPTINNGKREILPIINAARWLSGGMQK